MSLFGSLVRTAINVVLLPVEIVKDLATCGGVMNGKREENGQSYTKDQLDRIKDEAED